MKYIYNLAFKMAISATIALSIGEFFNVQYATVAAVIAILSIQDTRKKALEVGKNRIIACILGIFLSVILYSILGHSPLAFGVFLIILIPLTSKFKVEEGMVPAVVLSTHFLVANIINGQWILNELLIMIIGITTASIANLFMPSLTDNFRKDREWIEEKYSVILYKISKSLINNTVDIDEEKLMKSVEVKLMESKDTAYKIVNNNFLKANSYYTDYINMRINQFDNLKGMRLRLQKLNIPVEQMMLVGNFTRKVSENISEMNDCSELLKDLDELYKEFKNMELPKTRAEFESRAQLFHYLNDMEDFLNCKKNYCNTVNKDKK